jgi:membrane associated rhomboid family serine protease
MSVFQEIRTAFDRRDNALNQLLLLNVLVFAALIVLHAGLTIGSVGNYYEPVLRQFALSSSLPVLARHPWTVLTYAFTHEGFFHILFNLLNLYWFGQIIREYLGNRRLVSLYVLGGLAGALVFLLSYNFLPAFQPGLGTSVVGASASVTAIIVAAATLLPDYTFMLILLGPVKIKWIAVAVVLISLAGINGGNPGGEITHLGGALLGFVFIKQLKAGRDLGRPIQAIGDWVGNLFSRRPAMSVSTRRPEPVTTGARGARPAAAAGQPHPDEVDSILEKISRSGYESLSKDEKQKLFRASQQ